MPSKQLNKARHPKQQLKSQDLNKDLDITIGRSADKPGENGENKSADISKISSSDL